MKSFSWKSGVSLGLLLGIAVHAQNKEVTKFVPLSQILEARAVREELVPDYAANDEDFIRFITAIRSRVPSTQKPRPLARVFETETQTSGVNAHEMFTRIRTLLISLRSDIEILNAAAAEKQAKRGFSTTLVCANIQACLGFGIRLGIGFGFEKRGSWYLPILNLKAQGTIFKSGEFNVIATGDIGFESFTNADSPKAVSRRDEFIQGGAVGVGVIVSGPSAESDKYRSLAFGAGLVDGVAAGYEFNIPVFFPIPVSDPVAKGMRLLSELANSIQHFDLARAAMLTTQFRTQVSIVKAEYKTRAGSELSSVPIEDGHPLFSPGHLFSGSSLVMHSPDLVPDLVGSYGVRKKNRKAKCDGPLAMDIEATQVSVAEGGGETKALRE